MDQVAVGRRIAAARKRAGIATRKELAERVSIPRLGKETLGKIERGERPLYEHEAPYVARALEVPVSYFFEDDSAETQLDRIEADLQAARTERVGLVAMLDQRIEELDQRIADQNANLARQTELLARIEERERAIFRVLEDAEVIERAASDGVLPELPEVHGPEPAQPPAQESELGTGTTGRAGRRAHGQRP